MVEVFLAEERERRVRDAQARAEQAFWKLITHAAFQDFAPTGKS